MAPKKYHSSTTTPNVCVEYSLTKLVDGLLHPIEVCGRCLIEGARFDEDWLRSYGIGRRDIAYSLSNGYGQV